jgi:hypothetical protein
MVVIHPSQPSSQPDDSVIILSSLALLNTTSHLRQNPQDHAHQIEIEQGEDTT